MESVKILDEKYDFLIMCAQLNWYNSIRDTKSPQRECDAILANAEARNTEYQVKQGINVGEFPWSDSVLNEWIRMNRHRDANDNILFKILNIKIISRKHTNKC